MSIKNPIKKTYPDPDPCVFGDFFTYGKHPINFKK